eukprot:51310-Pleurochrysis_carterae.AAC.1
MHTHLCFVSRTHTRALTGPKGAQESERSEAGLEPRKPPGREDLSWRGASRPVQAGTGMVPRESGVCEGTASASRKIERRVT